jgi:regulator of sigma E protease
LFLTLKTGTFVLQILFLIMDLFIQISQFILSLSLLIVLHELGHFIPAKLFKTRVEKFYLFFDVKYSLFKKKIGDTVYGIGWLPLGGYVKISGMIDESMDTDQMKEEPKPWEFRSKPSWQRLIIMLGGVTVNFILAAVIYILMAFAYGSADIDAKSVVGGYEISNPVLNEIGLETGDKIVSINGEEIEFVSEITPKLIEAKTVKIERDGNLKSLNFPVDFLGKLSSSKTRGLVELRTPFVFSGASEGSINSEVDIMDGDLLLSVNDQPAKFEDQVLPLFESNKGETVKIKIKRSNYILERTLAVNNDGKVEIFHKLSPKDFEAAGFYKTLIQDYTFAQSIGVGFNKFISTVSSYWAQLKLIASPSTGAYKGVGGFKAILDIFPDTWSWVFFWNITAFLSVMLGVLNLLPIPALDGGHVMFLLYEMVSGRKPSDKFMEYAQTIGFFILIALVLFANGNDIYKAIFN